MNNLESYFYLLRHKLETDVRFPTDIVVKKHHLSIPHVEMILDIAIAVAVDKRYPYRMLIFIGKYPFYPMKRNIIIHTAQKQDKGYSYYMDVVQQHIDSVEKYMHV